MEGETVPAQPTPSTDDVLRERKEKLAQMLRIKKHWGIALIVVVLAYFSYWLRTRNLGGLRDVTTNTWTLGPDLDPFLFLRWAKDIVAHGTLMPLDPLRYIPLPYSTGAELLGLPYMIAWFHKIAVAFGSISVEHSAVLFPAVMFSLTVVAFFFLAYRIFLDSRGKTQAVLIAALASLFLIVNPSLLPRTIAGIPEKESAGFLFLFLALYCFIASWKSTRSRTAWLWALGAGLATAVMNLTWGGVAYILFTISVTLVIVFLLAQVTRTRALSALIWLIGTTAFSLPLTERYSPLSYLISIPPLLTMGVIAAFVVSEFIGRARFRSMLERTPLAKLPRPFLALLLIAVLGLLLSLLYSGPDFILGKFSEVKSNMVSPITDRLGVTVAENRQPFFDEWANNFGPVVQGVPLFFWLFVFGSIFLVHKFTHAFKQSERWTLTLAYTFFLIAIIFSRYAPGAFFDGTNTVSLLFYASGFIVLLAAFGKVYFTAYQRGEEQRLRELDIGIIILLVFFFLGIVSARGAVRLIMMLVLPTSLIVAYFVVAGISDALKLRDELAKTIGWIVTFLVFFATFYAGWQFYNISKGTAQSYVPGVYTHQWQRAMAWVRDTTPQDAVFAHWWDYGYWVQSLGERATVLDGGNAYPYWDHLMGRHALTGRDTPTALEFLYTHKVTHLLIDSSDIGKYGAFSSIGSDENYDRRSWIPVFSRQRMEEAKNRSILTFQGGFPLDQDLRYTDENSTIVLPEGKAAVGAVIFEKDRNGSLASQPRAIFVYQKSKSAPPAQYTLPLRYAYHNLTSYDYGKGVEAGIVALPAIAQNNALERDAAVMYLSNKTVRSHLARLYLTKERDPAFTLAHSEDDVVVQQLKSAGLLGPEEDFVIYQGVRGPLRIWEVHYPENIKTNPAYLETSYPDERLRRT